MRSRWYGLVLWVAMLCPWTPGCSGGLVSSEGPAVADASMDQEGLEALTQPVNGEAATMQARTQDPSSVQAPGEIVPSGEVLPASKPETLALGPGRLRVAEIDGAPVFADEVFPRLYLSLTKEAAESVRQVVIERIVECEVKRLHLAIGAEAIDAETARVMTEHEANLRSMTQGARGLKEYVEQTLGMEEQTFRDWVRRGARMSLLLELLVRYELRGQERAELRLLRVKSRELARQVVEKLRRGASFSALAREHSVDSSAADGGSYPPLPLETGSPILERTRAMKDGELSDVEEVETPEGTQYRVLQFVRRWPADFRSLEDQRPEIEAELRERPLSSIELDAWMSRMERQYRVRSFGAGIPEE